MGGVLTNVVGFCQSRGFVKEKFRYPYKLRLFASPNLWESFFVTDFMVALSVGKQKIETCGGRQKKENRIQKFEVESRK